MGEAYICRRGGEADAFLMEGYMNPGSNIQAEDVELKPGESAWRGQFIHIGNPSRALFGNGIKHNTVDPFYGKCAVLKQGQTMAVQAEDVQWIVRLEGGSIISTATNNSNETKRVTVGFYSAWCLM